MKLTDLQKLNQDPKIKASIFYLERNGYLFGETAEDYQTLLVTNPAGRNFKIEVFNILKLAECVHEANNLLIQVK